MTRSLSIALSQHVLARQLCRGIRIPVVVTLPVLLGLTGPSQSSGAEVPADYEIALASPDVSSTLEAICGSLTPITKGDCGGEIRELLFEAALCGLGFLPMVKLGKMVKSAISASKKAAAVGGGVGMGVAGALEAFLCIEAYNAFQDLMHCIGVFAPSPEQPPLKP